MALAPPLKAGRFWELLLELVVTDPVLVLVLVPVLFSNTLEMGFLSHADAPQLLLPRWLPLPLPLPFLVAAVLRLRLRLSLDPRLVSSLVAQPLLLLLLVVAVGETGTVVPRFE
jgi:hypothetical protein